MRSLSRRLSITPTRVVFFDRDGVLNEDHGYVFRPEDFQWVLGAREAISWLNESDIKVAVATNQSGIGRGFYTEQDFLLLCKWMQAQLRKLGAHIDAFFHCPHIPSDECFCRKPKPGMLLQGIERFGVKPNECLFIGDKESDMQAAQAAGTQSFHYAGGNLLESVRRCVLIDR